ncbi:tetratricopeptide repeat protein [Mycobacterium sp. WUMAC-067]|uniref:tetratricopeptide repeat protein n=1 Tax=unclassified Mycobacterium TaxID=2642494 RepID=UPI001CDA222C|nr:MULTISPECIES: tetratricopeptide repeat protein [unclassified Mycobacterium]MCA2240901.1 tetratricopeptide repeat protein [Mycobacterium sp. WUMAC-067]MCA2313127.1 tetratricopeptide repeat protein [Mycobacterium sp. WUMAC-025]
MTSEPGLGRIDEAIRVADAYIDARKYESAREILGRSLSQNPNDPALLASYSRAELALGNYWPAARSAYAALSGAPDNEFAMRLYALSLYGLGRRDDGLWMAWRAVTSHPNEPAPLRLYALLLQRARQLRSALDVIDRALRLDPQNVEALIRRGSILDDMGLRNESEAAYRAALQLDPANAEALNDLAVHRLGHFKFGRALQGFLGAAGSDPEYGELSRRNIGVVLRKVLTLVTIGACVLSVLLAVTAGVYDEGRSTAALRVLVGLLTAILVAVLRWLLRAIPRQVFIAVLREQYFFALRLAHAGVVVVAGAWVTVCPWPPGMIAVGGMLAVAALVIMRIGLFIRK